MHKYILPLIGIIVIWQNLDAPISDRQKFCSVIEILLCGAENIDVVSYDALPVAECISNTNVAGRFIIIDECQFINLPVTNGVTEQRMDAWRSQNISNTNYLQWTRGLTVSQILSDSGMRERR